MDTLTVPAPVANRTVNTLFTAEEADKAYTEWSANCGPGALAAVAHLGLDAVRPHLKGFDDKHYTNPTMMLDALRSLKIPFKKLGPVWPKYGLARIQWHGPWTNPGVPAIVAYRQTHWVGSATGEDGSHGIFDINAINNGSGWSTYADWTDVLVPYLLTHIPKSDGRWSVTHGLELWPL